MMESKLKIINLSGVRKSSIQMSLPQLKSHSSFAKLLLLSLLILPIRFFPFSKLNGISIINIRQYINISLIFILFIVILLWAYLKKTYQYWQRLDVPCSRPSLIVGHTLQRFGISKPITEFYDEVYYDYNGKDFCGFYDFVKPGLIVGNLQLIKNILIKDFDHFANRRVLPLGKVNPIANDMLSNATGEHWKKIRSAISPTFTAHKLRQLYPLIEQRGDSFIKLLTSLGGNKREIEVRSICGQFTMDTIASCAFGIECDAMNSDAATFTRMAAKIFVFSPARALKIITLLMAPSLAHWVQLVGIDFTSPEFRFFHKVVTKTLQMRERNGIRRGDFLDLMKDTKILSETTMTAQAILFLLAGYDNIANTLAFTLHLLAVNPKIQEDLRKEIHGVISSSVNKGISHETLQKMSLLDAVVKETLRLYPASPVMERICTKDYHIPGTNISVYEGQPLIVPIWSIHRDPSLWADHESFKPERFLDADESQMAYLPFGAGPRQCIGMKFAVLVIKVGLVKVLTHLAVIPTSNTQHPPALDPRSVLSLVPKDGLPLGVVPLEGFN